MGGGAMGGRGKRGPASPYEVRCLRCDVSFPVETRRCIHCGGPTSASSAGVDVAAFTGRVEAGAPGSAAPSSPAPISLGDRADPDEPGGPGDAPPQPGIGVTLLRSFGSLFWVIALIGFSLARSCSEG